MKRLFGCIVVLASCGRHAGETLVADPPAAAKLDVTSPAFVANAEIPIDHTCEGADIAPPLAWSGAPAATKTFAIVVDDPDAPDPNAPKQTWVHWVLVNVPATVTSLPANAGLHPPQGAANGTNDFHKTLWGGPCPPIGRHRYFFKVYALDAQVGSAGITKDALMTAIEGHVLANGVLVGTYQKKS